MDFSQLHDSSLREVRFDWFSGNLEVLLTGHFNDHRIDVYIRAEGLQHFSCDRLFPWGPSQSVNGVVVNQEGTVRRMEIEMQSGDLLVIKAASIELRAKETHADGKPS